MTSHVPKPKEDEEVQDDDEQEEDPEDGYPGLEAINEENDQQSPRIGNADDKDGENLKHDNPSLETKPLKTNESHLNNTGSQQQLPNFMNSTKNQPNHLRSRHPLPVSEFSIQCFGHDGKNSNYIPNLGHSYNGQ